MKTSKYRYYKTEVFDEHQEVMEDYRQDKKIDKQIRK